VINNINGSGYNSLENNRSDKQSTDTPNSDKLLSSSKLEGLTTEERLKSAPSELDRILGVDYNQKQVSTSHAADPKDDSSSSVTTSSSDNFSGVLYKSDTDAKKRLETHGEKPTDQIIRLYQVVDDVIIPEWRIKTPIRLGPVTIWREIPGTTVTNKTSKELQMIQQLYFERGLIGIKKLNEILSPEGTDQSINAYRVADQKFPRTDMDGNPVVGSNDGHNDAFRHMFFNAMLTKEFGVEFATSIATAHEGIPRNPAEREAMDLFNNKLGRRIAVENPDASPEELAELIHAAILEGEALVINGDNELVYSDEEAVGQTGEANDVPLDGIITPPEWPPPENTES
jgi:hypothetical protein